MLLNKSPKFKLSNAQTGSNDRAGLRGEPASFVDSARVLGDGNLQQDSHLWWQQVHGREFGLWIDPNTIQRELKA